MGAHPQAIRRPSETRALFRVDFRRHCLASVNGILALLHVQNASILLPFTPGGTWRIARGTARAGRLIRSGIHHCRCKPIPEKTLGYLALTLLHECTANVPRRVRLETNQLPMDDHWHPDFNRGLPAHVRRAAEDPTAFSEEIFSTRRITIAPIVVLLGYGTIFYAILKR